MENTHVNVHSQEYMETMARLMSEALESPEGMRALAAAIAAPIEQEIKRKEISSLLLTRHTLPKGERPLYQKKPKSSARRFRPSCSRAIPCPRGNGRCIRRSRRSRLTGSATRARPRNRNSARTRWNFPPIVSTRHPWSMFPSSKTATSVR